MTEDPDFTVFWAIFPRKDRKIEARFEFTRQAAAVVGHARRN